MGCLQKEKNESKFSDINKRRLLIVATKQTRWIFSLLGVWPMLTKNTKNIEKRLSLVIQLICQSFLFFIIIPAAIQLYWCEKNMKIKLAYFGALGFTTACAVKYITIVYRRREIRECIEQIEKDWHEVVSEETNQIMLKNIKISQRMTIICGSFMYCGGVLHQTMIPFLPGSIVSIVDNSSRRLLVYPIYEVMFDDQITPTYEIMYLIHIVTGMIVCTIAIGSCHLSILFITHVSGQNQIMISKLKNLMNTRDETIENMNQCMREIIYFHHEIIKFSSNVEKCLREICLIAIFEALLIICLAEYYSMVAWKHNETFSAIIYFILVDAFIFNCFIFCHVGEILQEQFRKVGEAVYMTEWYRLSHRNARALMLIIAVIQHPPKLTAGGLIELSYNGFVSIIKSTAAYFNILRMTEF
uniref:Odorant receptor n=1 Tax=Meteorus pulchricornis TaxID=51522 RepID=A0A1S5VFT0_9HYME|nr:olfactory receptor 85 [Meteorus pulchricornis]